MEIKFENPKIRLVHQISRGVISLCGALYLAMSTMAIVTNRVLLRKAPEETHALPGIVHNRGFCVEEAMTVNDSCLLPTNKSFRISSFIRMGEESDWTSTSFDSHTRALTLRVFERVRQSDPWFTCYTGAPQSSKYIPIGAELLNTFSAFVIRGFGQPESRMLTCRVLRLLRETVENYQDRCRKELREKLGPAAPEELLLEVKAQMQSGLLPRVHLDPPF